MRLNENYAIRKIADEYIMVAHVGNNLDYTRAIGLNETTVYLLEALEGKDFVLEDVVQLLTARYEVSDEQALLDGRTLVTKLLELGIVKA